jgi:hypothetical protein
MLKLTLAFAASWSADGFVYVNPSAIGSVVRLRPRGLIKVEHTAVNLLVAGEDGEPCFYPVTETPEEILARIDAA